MTDSVKTYSLLATPVAGSTGTGLDQLTDAIATDPGLAGANIGSDIQGGLTAASTLNAILVQAITALNLGTAGHVFTASEVVKIHDWIAANRQQDWTNARGQGTATVETGYYLVQGDGGSTRYRGEGLIDTVAASIFQIGGSLNATKTQFLNQDLSAGVTTDKVAAWLTQFYTDHSSTHTGLDRMTDLMMADKGLATNNADAKIAAGVDAGNGMMTLISSAITALNLGADGRISESDVRAIHDWIRADPVRYQTFVALHGDDENGVETGFHLIQGDGGTTTMFGRNLVNTVADGIFHIGFNYSSDGTRFVNEDGDDNQTVSDVANWLNYFYADQSTTGTGLDRIVDTIKIDRGLAQNTDAGQIAEGADAANGLNQMLVQAITDTGTGADGWITVEDLYSINGWVHEFDDRYTQFVALHGDDEGGEESGFHNVQNDGGSTQYFGRNLINTVADGIYHFGFSIENGRFLNEDGDANQTLEDVSAWLNTFYFNKTLVQGTEAGESITGSAAQEVIVGEGGNDSVDGGGGADLIYGGWGNDQVKGGAGTDLIYGGTGRDRLDGGQDGDIYRVTGSEADGWSGFGDYDTYADTGTTGIDVIEAVGPGNVDIGLTAFGPTSGIEKIDATKTGGDVRLIGDWNSNLLDFRTTTFVGAIAIASGYGDDTVYGTAGADRIAGEGGNDKLFGGNGSDTYVVTGNEEGGWSEFGGYDLYTDTGAASDTDTIRAICDARVDVGLVKFTAASGIEVIDGTGALGGVRLLGDWTDNMLDFHTTTFLGTVGIDGGYGNDTIVGTTGDDILGGNGGDDVLDGYKGSDTYIVTGNLDAGWCSFAGYDLYKDSGNAEDIDTIIAIGDGSVDIGLKSFGSQTGIEVIDATGAAGLVRLLGDWTDNMLDFSGVELVGSNILIDGGSGNDSITGTGFDDSIAGSGGDDLLDGAEGGDTYRVSGNEAGGWSSFAGFDTYHDTGSDGATDRILAVGTGPVDIGLSGFGPQSGIEIIDGTGAVGQVRLLGNWESNLLDFTGVQLLGQVVIYGGYGDDTIIGSTDADRLVAGGGNDLVDGAESGDTYVVNGNVAGGWSSFGGFDTYADSGTGGVDTILAKGTGNVDVGLSGFDASNGIEVIDATAATGTVRLLGDWTDDVLDFSTTQFKGKLVIDGGGGADELIGNASDNSIVGGTGRDVMDGRNGADTYIVTGNVAGGWSSFSDYDTYGDSGATGTDTILASGKGNVDIGLDEFDASSGIEVIDATGATGRVRLLGDWESDTFNFTGVTFKGKITIDAGGGDDTVIGTAGGETIAGGDGNDVLTGGLGNDAFLFNAKPNVWGNVDTITDFSVPGDTILIDHLAFSKIGAVGAFAAANLVIGTKALDAADRLIYDKVTGNLFYDADGSGKGAAVVFAHLSAGLALTSADFLIV